MDVTAILRTYFSGEKSEAALILRQACCAWSRRCGSGS